MCKEYVAIILSKYSLHSGILKSPANILVLYLYFILNLILFLYFSSLIGLFNAVYPIMPHFKFKEVNSMHTSRF